MGGIFELTSPDYSDIPSHWMTYLTVSDIEQAEQDTVREGGEVMRPSALIPGVGKLAVVTDFGRRPHRSHRARERWRQPTLSDGELTAISSVRRFLRQA